MKKTRRNKYLLISILLMILIAGLDLNAAVFSAAVTIRVKDYGAVPNDGQDDSAAIQSAIDAAISQNTAILSFEAGTYNFSKNPIGGTSSNAYMHVLSANNLQLLGAKDPKGNPATKWVRYNTGEPAADLRQLLFIGNSSNISVENFIVDNDPYYYSAGTVVSKNGSRVTVDVLEGHPRWDGMKVFLPGAYDFANKRFIRQRIIWTPDDGSNAPVMHTISGGDGRLMYVDSAEISNAVHAGDGLFWFQGNYSPSAQMIMNYNVKDLNYENVKILNSTGFALTSDFCMNITYTNVSLVPEGNRIATAPRDGFNIADASGNVLMDHITIDGICDDGQNCHGFWTTIKQKVDARTIIANPYPYAQMPLTIGSAMKITSGDTTEYIWEGTIASYQYLAGRSLQITFHEDLPSGIVYCADGSHEGKSMLEPTCWYPSSYIVRNSTIRNSYRGLKTGAANVQVYSCNFEYNQYDIFLGAENDPYFFEGRHPENVMIHDNTFRRSNSGTGIELDFLDYPSRIPSSVMSGIRIYNNLFYSQQIGINITDTKDSYFYNNIFTNCTTDMHVDPKSTKGLVFEEPPTSSENSSSESSSFSSTLLSGVSTSEHSSSGVLSNSPGDSNSVSMITSSGASVFSRSDSGPSDPIGSESSTKGGDLESTIVSQGESAASANDGMEASDIPDVQQTSGRNEWLKTILLIATAAVIVYIILLFMYRYKLQKGSTNHGTKK